MIFSDFPPRNIVKVENVGQRCQGLDHFFPTLP